MKKPVISLLNIGYWLLYLLLFAMILFSLQLGVKLSKHPSFLNYKGIIFLTSFAFVPAATGYYGFYNWLFTKYLSKKKLGAFFIGAVIVSFIGGALGSIMLTILSWLHIGVGVFSDGVYSSIPIILLMSVIALLNGVVGLVMKGFISWYGDIKLKEELNKKNFETELALVKSQLDPHFLFNTINNIDVLIEKDAASASRYLNQLSAIMRFMLYETRTEKITLQQELLYIEKYIALQKIRSTNPNYIQYEVEGSTENILITPMLFIPFIENAFKHSENRKADNSISILFSIEADTITFECKNNCEQTTHFNDSNNGLGNELMKKRLALLYPEKHSLDIINTTATYTVQLKIFYK